MMPNKWDVWLVEVQFEDIEGAKIRPALVIDPQKNYVIVGKMTSHAPRDKFPYEYPLQDWQGAGLTKPTTLRLSQRPQIEIGKFKKKLGVVQPIDMVRIYSMLSEIIREK